MLSPGLHYHSHTHIYTHLHTSQSYAPTQRHTWKRKTALAILSDQRTALCLVGNPELLRHMSPTPSNRGLETSWSLLEHGELSGNALSLSVCPLPFPSQHSWTVSSRPAVISLKENKTVFPTLGFSPFVSSRSGAGHNDCFLFRKESLLLKASTC